ncbi:MAG: bifunctional serine/threonine-protein kinase/formylglycine-generating enzyme family protein [Pirellulales bacterium]
MNQHPNYELFEELGRGENTVVYRAYDLSLGREVAIKELDESGRRDPRHRERFLREAQFLAQFEHDNVLRVYSVDTERGWIIMEMMKGTLESVIAGGPSDPDLVRSVLKQTLEALAFLHEKNKVHCAVRPSNLLINDAGRVKLSEFEQTDAGGEIRVPTGSKKYLAPELIRPDFGDFGPPLDLYCLGFAALEMLKGPQFESLFPGTGKGAIDADTAWLRWHSSPGALDSTRKLVKGIPDDLARVLDHMLQKRVADRPQSAQEVLKELADRPLVPVPVAGASGVDEVDANHTPALAPGVIKVLAAPQNVQPRVQYPAADQPPTKPARSAKPAASKGKLTAPRFSKDWFNQQLSRPYVLYPLCAVILLGAFWFSFGRHIGGEPDPADTLVAVTFDVQPSAKDVKVSVDKTPVVAGEDGTYPFQPGRYAVTWSKDGFQPVTRELDVTAETNKFTVKLEPVIKYIDVLVEVKPAEAKLQVAGDAKTLADGSYTHKLQENQPLQVEARLDGYVPVSRSLSPEELTKLANKVTLVLEKEKPRLPASLVAKPGAKLDPEVQLPVRVFATAFGDKEPLELVLVKAGSYSFGNSNDDRQESELSARKVEIEEPFYIAIHETTNAQYQKFFEKVGEAQAGNRWQKASEKWAAPLELDAKKNTLPVTNVSPQQATAFCTWLGGRLPTEIEWESAVRGPKDSGFPFPWGSDELTRERCQIFYGELSPLPVEKLTAGSSSLGLMNTLGNAAEWCHSTEEPASFILRGCSFATANINHVRVTWRGTGDPKGEEDTGFRIVIPATENGATVPAAIASGEESPKESKIPAPLKFLSTLPWKAASGALGLGR